MSKLSSKQIEAIQRALAAASRRQRIESRELARARDREIRDRLAAVARQSEPI